LEEAPTESSSDLARPWQIITLSAKTPAALEQMTQKLITHLQRHPEQLLADIAYTLQVGRRSWPHRRMCLCQTPEAAVRALGASESLQHRTAHVTHERSSIVFMFSGQGTQYVNMARGLYETEPVFRQTLDRCCDILINELGADDIPLLELIYPVASLNDDCSEDLAERLQQTAYAQPALFVIEYALATLWISWGVKPHALIGHSIGEYVAACIAGVFSVEDGLALIVQRGRLMQRCKPGSMLSVMQPASQIQNQLPKNLEIAVINSPHTCVVSGPIEAIAAFQADLNAKLIPCRVLKTSHAFHSKQMEAALADFSQVMERVSLHGPQMDLISNVTGTWLTDAEATDPSYWVNHLRSTVCFSQGITELMQLSHPIFLEVGPGHTLAKLAQQHLADDQDVSIFHSLPHPGDPSPDTLTVMTTLGNLWLTGVSIQWADVHQGTKRHRYPLPTYPFERESYWIPLTSETLRSTVMQELGEEAESDAALAKAPDMADWFYLPSWRRSPLIQSHLDTVGGCWLIFATTSIQASLKPHLTNRVNPIIWVMPGATFSSENQPENDTYTLQPRQQRDYQQLVQVLQDRSHAPSHIIYAWGMDDEESEVESFNGLVYLVRAIRATLRQASDFTVPGEIAQSSPSSDASQNSDRRDKFTLSVITTGVQDVTGSELLNPEHAKLLGLCQVIPQEYPGVSCRTIDIDTIDIDTMGAMGDKPSASLQGLCQELMTAYDQDQRITAYRNGHRWVQTYESVSLPDRQPSLLKSGETYLIAGDLVDGLGMVYAQALVHDLDAKVILLARPGLPASSDWEKWLATHSPQHSVSQLIRKIQALGTEGETFFWFSGDLADAAWVEDCIHQGVQHMGKIHGVFHAGVMGDQASCALAEPSQQQITQVTDEESGSHWNDKAERICRSKIQGLQTLQRVLAHQPIAFYALQSSLSTIVGGVGFGAYAAANCYLDAVAHQQQHDRAHWISLNWDACSNEDLRSLGSGSQQHVSTSINGEPRDLGGRESGALAKFALTSDEVWQVTRRALAQPECHQLIVSPRNLQARLQDAFKPVEGTLSNGAPDQHPSAYARPTLSTEYVAPRNLIEQAVAHVMEDLLGIEQVGVHDNFFELGGHSLLAIQAVTRLRQEYQVDLPMRAFLFESPTVEGIAKIIRDNQATFSLETQSTIENLLEQIEGMSREEVEQQ
jgi:acyl transferase domain-containing protein/acyl carrier protein